MTGQEQKIKISDLPASMTFRGLWTIGYQVDTEGRKTSVRVSLDEIQKAYEDVVQATGAANTAAKNAVAATERATTAAITAEKINETVSLQEAERVKAESVREAAETERNRKESLREEAEELRDTAEEERNTAEIERKNKEIDRETAEEERILAETLRKESETIREGQETGRVEAEKVRIEAENLRSGAEALREQFEDIRTRQEAGRETAEALREASELDRDKAEEERIASELIRKENEDLRIQAENARKEAESIRAAEELKRAEAERIRQAAEDIRKEQESKRQTDTEAAILKAETATTNATDATTLMQELNGHPMKPQGGYWFQWNTETGAYENTGIQAKGDVGASFKIIGRHDTLEELEEAVPDGSGVDGVYAVGAQEPYSYYAWVVVDGVYRWDNQGQLRGAEGKSAYEVWMEDPANAGKTEEDYFDWLSPIIDPKTGQWKVQGIDTGIRAKAVDAHITVKADEPDRYQLSITTVDGEIVTPNLHGTSARISENPENSEKVYRLDIADAKGSLTTPNLRGRDGEKYVVPTLDHEPGESDLSWDDGGVLRPFEIGYMCRWFNPEKGENGAYVFYQLHDIKDGKALWKKAGSGGSDDMETATVVLTTEDGDVSKLIGISISIRHGITLQEQPYDGVGLTFQVPANAEYTVAVGDLDGFTTPPEQTFIAGAENMREITFEYLFPRNGKIRLNLSEGKPANITGDVNAAFYRRAADMCRRCVVVGQDADGVHIRYLSDSGSWQYENGASADLGGRPVMVFLPECWVNATRAEDGTFVDVEISSELKIGWQHFPSSLAGVFKMGENAVSSPGSTIRTNMSWNEAARACWDIGEGWQMVDYRQHCLVALLLYARYGTRDIRSIIGSNKPYIDGMVQTGETMAIGIQDTKADGVNNFTNCLGLEAWTGYMQEWMDGVSVLDGIWYLFGEHDEVREVEATMGTGWITGMVFENGGAFDLVPATTGMSGSNTTGYTEFSEAVNAPFLEMGVARGNFTYEDAPDDGIARVSVTLPLDVKGRFTGTRAAYYGNIIVESD